MDLTHSDPSMHVFAVSADWLNVRMLLRKAGRLGPTGSFPIPYFRASRFEEHVIALEKIDELVSQVSRFTS